MSALSMAWRSIFPETGTPKSKGVVSGNVSPGPAATGGLEYIHTHTHTHRKIWVHNGLSVWCPGDVLNIISPAARFGIGL